MKRYDFDNKYGQWGSFARESLLGYYVEVIEVEELQALTKEFAEGIICNATYTDSERGDEDVCVFCGEREFGGVKHLSNCEFLKAQQYLEGFKGVENGMECFNTFLF